MAIFATYSGGQGTMFACSRGSSGRGSISITAENGGLKVVTPYNAEFVNELKALIPATSRKWDSSQKAWYVTRDCSDQIKQIVDRVYGGDVQMPTVIAAAAEVFEVAFQADYVAACKNGVASIHCNGGWNAKVSEKTLRAWFKQVDNSAPATLYGLLGLEQTARPEEIKKAYKRAARTWHPDICREPDARERFEEIKDAFDVLIEPLARNKYNAGLMFEAMARTGGRSQRTSGYSTFTPVLRCGNLTVKAKRELGVLVIEEILAWEDVTNEHGQIMVSFWAGDNFSVMWV